MSAVYASSKFVGEMVRELLLALAGLKHETLTKEEAIAVYDEWLSKLEVETGCQIIDDPEQIKPGEN